MTYPDVSAIQQRVRAEIATPPRLAYSALLTASSLVAATVTSLLLTEPNLPARTQIAFAAIALGSAAWAAFAVWVLARRRVLFGEQHVAAARIAVTITAIFLAGATALTPRLGWAAPATGAVFFAAALALLARARRRVRKLHDLAQTFATEEAR